MSWDDEPPHPSEIQSWDSTPPQEKELEPISKLESFGRAAANNFPLMPQAIAGGESLTGLGDEGGYSKNLESWNQKAAAAKTANPKIYGAGAVTGAVAPLLIPGVGEALEAAPIAGNVVLGATSAISNTDLLKHPKEAIEEGVLGAGIGGATAGILGKLLPTGKGLENIASRKAIQSVEMPSGIVGAMAPEERAGLSKFIQENGLINRDKTEALQTARELSKKYGEKIGEIGNTAQHEFGEGLHLDPITHMDEVNKLLNKAQEFKGSANREAKSLTRDYTAGASDLVNLSDNPSWNQIQKLKEQYGKLAFKSTGEVKSEGAKDTYFALKNMLKNIADRAQNNPNLGTEYKHALKGYSMMQPIESGLEKAVDSELRGNGSGMGVRGMVGMIKKMPGPVRAVAGPVAAMAGHPFMGLAAALPEMTNPALQSKAATGAANLAKRLPSSTIPALNQEVHSHLINDAVKSYLMDEFGNKR